MALHSVDLTAATRREAPGLFRSFGDLAILSPEPDWVWDGYLARGQLTMLAGHAFVGKSLLVAGLLKALEKGSPFLGRPTSPASALLVSEEDEGVMRGRAEKFGLLDLRCEFASRNSGSLRLPWQELLRVATERSLEKGHQLLVIDTFAGLAGLSGEDENHAGAVMERLSPLVAAAGEGLSVLFLHHMNDRGESRGSKAFRSAVDIMVRLYRSGKRKQLRLEADGRSPGGTPLRLDGVLKQETPQWEYALLKTPTSDDQAPEHAKRADELLRDALQQARPDGLTYADFDDFAGLSRDIAAKRLPRWYPERVDRLGSGNKGNPYRWFFRA